MNREFLKELGLEDETIDKVMSAHGKAVESVKPKEDYEELKSTKTTLEQHVRDLQSELESNKDALGSIDDLKSQIESYKINELKTNIARQANIPFELAGRLSGSTEEELKADAEKMAEFVNKKQPLPLKHTEPPVNDKDAGLKQMLGNLNKNQGE